MLSYRHAFHTGNHADVLKHAVLVQLLGHLAQKEKPFWYIDTHAGAGRYDLAGHHARRTAEYETGIGRIWHEPGPPAPLADYLALVRSFNPDGKLRFYPGSPLIAQRLLRRDDAMHLFELHSTDFAQLQRDFGPAGKRFLLHASDGLAGARALLPPQPRRALVLVDPPYELDDEYRKVPDCLGQCLKRFATGIYAVWYPLLQKREALEFPGKLQALAGRWLDVTLQVKAPGQDRFGMYGSGMLVVNPPWTLEAALAGLMPWLRDRLALDGAARFGITTHGLT